MCKTRFISLFVAASMVLTLCFSASAKERRTLRDSGPVISVELQERLNELEDDDTIQVIAYLKRELPNTRSSSGGIEVISSDMPATLTNEQIAESKRQAMEDFETFMNTAAAPIPDDVLQVLEENNALLREERQSRMSQQKSSCSTLISRVLEKNNISEDHIQTKGDYDPLMILTLSKAQIQALELEDFIFINYFEDEAVVPSLSIANQATGSTYLSNTWNMKGNGITVGIIDSYEVTGNLAENFENSEDGGENMQGRSKVHATQMARIIRATAPSADVIATTMYFVSDFIEAVNVLKREGADVISMSLAKINDGNYGEWSRMCDYLCRDRDIPLVVGSGNLESGSQSNHYASEAALALNVIAVGACNDKRTVTQNDDSFTTDFNRWVEGDASGRNVPDCLAPGVNLNVGGAIVSGSSLAAPQVAGAIAQWAQYNQDVLLSPTVAKALAAVSCWKKIDGDTLIIDDNNSVIYDQQGAGLFNAKIAGESIRGNKFVTFDVAADSDESFEWDIDVGSGDVVLRVAIAWTHTVENMTDIEIGDEADFDLVLFDPDGNEVASSESSDNNLEVVEIEPEMTGTYTVEIQNFAGPIADSIVTLAWW